MGNCMKKESSPTRWIGDNSSHPYPAANNLVLVDDHKLGNDQVYVSKATKMGLPLHNEEGEPKRVVTSSCSSSNSTVAEVKIKITKKQLEELLGKINVQGLSVQDVLGQLINVCNGYQTRQRSWMPALQSIPED